MTTNRHPIGIRREVVDGKMVEVKVFSAGSEPKKRINKNFFGRGSMNKHGGYICPGKYQRPDAKARRDEKMAAIRGNGDYNPEDF